MKCSKLCSEPCDRQICEHPSKGKIRKCRHPSIGVCGEKIPRLCRVCDKDEVEEIFFGREDEKDARFIELEDCKHVIEVNGLIQWMNSEPDSSESNSQNSIQFKKCPKCKTVIRHTRSLNTFIQASLRDIQEVKLKTYGHPRENRTTQLNLNRKSKDLLERGSFKVKTVHLSAIYAEIFHKTTFEGNVWPRPKHILIELTNKFELVEALKKICLSFEKRSKIRQQNVSTKAIEKFEERIRISAKFIKDYRNCDQKRIDIATEISFLQMMGDVIVKACNQTFNDAGKKLLDEAFELANKYGSATDSVREEFVRLVSEACKHSSGLGISLEEKRMVLRAMGFQRGHWYKCPNGHIYCIADCGGAVMTSQCPDCGSVIGGTSHSLVSGNSLASEMDGASVPAYPTNLQAQLRPFMDG